MAGTFVLEVGKTGKFRFNLRSGNHQVILTSETYESKAAAHNGIESVRKNATDASLFQRKTAKDGSAYFVLKAKNGEKHNKPVDQYEDYRKLLDRKDIDAVYICTPNNLHKEISIAAAKQH